MTASPQRPAPLLLVCALGIERRALRGGMRRHPRTSATRTVTGPQPGTPPGSDPCPAGGATTPHTPTPVRVLRTGMGPRSASRVVTANLHDDGTPVLVTGFCAGLTPGTRPGDLVVATRVSTASARDRADAPADTGLTIPETTTTTLTEALRARGLTVHTGPLTTTDHLVRRRERATLHAAGAIAADMETAAALHAALSAGDRPIAAVRVVVDTPEDELLHPRTLRTGLTAFGSLRAAVPAFLHWHTTLAGTRPARASAPTPDPAPTSPSHEPLSREVS